MRTRPARRRGGPGEIAGSHLNLEEERGIEFPQPKIKSVRRTFPDSGHDAEAEPACRDAKPSRNHSLEA